MSEPAKSRRRELTDGERVILIERAEKVRVLEATTREARHDLAVAAKVTQDAGASLRVIAEALSMSPAGVLALIRGA